MNQRKTSPYEPPPDLEVLESEDGQVMVMSFAVPPRDAKALSAAESEVAAYVLKGSSNAEIARARGCSERTVANQISSIFSKLGVHSRLELMVFAPLVNPERP